MRRTGKLFPRINVAHLFDRGLSPISSEDLDSGNGRELHSIYGLGSFGEYIGLQEFHENLFHDSAK